MNDILTLLLHPDPVLSEACAQCRPSERYNLYEAMLRACMQWRGYALAAPQIGLAECLFVIPPHQLLPSSCPRVVINPELSDFGVEEWQPESCLSIPGFNCRVKRPSSLVMRYTDEDGQAREYRCRGLLARVVQHESDHLRGILLPERIGDLGWQDWRRYEFARGRFLTEKRPITIDGDSATSKPR